jgi:2-amino-4-hydroxy-6-hydroxymethyldihydropteridine diphosphokinase
MKVIAYIGLGSNLDAPEEQIKRARIAIRQIQDVREHGFSSLYYSPPMGPQDQPEYVNAVMAIETELSAIQLLRCLQDIENTQGRVRKDDRWGARTLDLDLLLYADQQIDTPDLIVPHYGMGERAFVLYPLYEIAPDIEIPGKGLVSDLKNRCPQNGLTKADKI